jgi:hypothetical protein
VATEEEKVKELETWIAQHHHHQQHQQTLHRSPQSHVITSRTPSPPVSESASSRRGSFEGFKIDSHASAHDTEEQKKVDEDKPKRVVPERPALPPRHGGLSRQNFTSRVMFQNMGESSDSSDSDADSGVCSVASLDVPSFGEGPDSSGADDIVFDRRALMLNANAPSAKGLFLLKHEVSGEQENHEEHAVHDQRPRHHRLLHTQSAPQLTSHTQAN